MVLLALLFTFGSLAYWLLIQPQQDLNRQLAEWGRQYHRALTFEARREGLERQLERWQAALADNQAMLLRERSFSLAAAALQERLKSVVSLHDPAQRRCAIQQQRNVATKGDGPFTRVTVNVALNCHLEELQAVLYDLEASTPVMVLDNLTINRRSRDDLALSTQFDLSGFIRPDANGEPEGDPR
ncbi:general secretion pathway protein M [Marinobacter gudaonensis]|uniref:General secretion pathway protein M n=2 Tax=Marinobacter gudaonensis TaxID=375760 RepID=A0A1I6HZN1_9GAMM|nr:general secretion pathway protein M [Marinobacter gudaonensis]